MAVPLPHTEETSEGNNYLSINRWACNPLTNVENIVRDFEVRHDDVFVTGYAQSGTDWLASLLQQLYDWGTPRVTDNGLIPTLELASTPVKMGYTECTRAPSPRLIKSHLPYQCFPRHHFHGKTIVMIRNPKDVCVALYGSLCANQPDNHILSWNDFVSEFLCGNLPYGSWMAHSTDWLENKPANTLFVKYENLKYNLRKEIGSVLEFLGLPVTGAAIDSLATDYQLSATINLGNKLGFSNNDCRAYFAYRDFDDVGCWKKYFSVAQSDLMDEALSEMRERGHGMFLK
ncbi:sulfotransferase 1E1-like [Saccoglossus kowalevskii]|uniref:Estrogen sulfotransferase-like n=1 Tax=Saccoglossus kowalevskii TaxID=10224 RepID=A0ABM0LXV6_SACKO|nr:PREDICTED: estrogen sulfotransferase-like [Saccoglossus kowalevskii]